MLSTGFKALSYTVEDQVIYYQHWVVNYFSFLFSDYKNLINELNRIPVRNDSLKIRQRQVLMEKELDKLEEGIELFSKEKLFVKP